MFLYNPLYKIEKPTFLHITFWHNRKTKVRETIITVLCKQAHLVLGYQVFGLCDSKLFKYVPVQFCHCSLIRYHSIECQTACDNYVIVKQSCTTNFITFQKLLCDCPPTQVMYMCTTLMMLHIKDTTNCLTLLHANTLKFKVGAF